MSSSHQGKKKLRSSSSSIDLDNNNKLLRIWGEEMQSKNEHNYRILFQNINGIGRHKTQLRNEELLQFLTQTDADVALLTELNANWHRFRRQEGIDNIIRGRYECSKANVAFNRHTTTKGTYLPGGTGIISQGDLSLRFIKSGVDTKHLGRWSWQLFRGKNGKTLRMISAYVPNRSHEPGYLKVFNQQLKALIKLKDKRGVLEAYWEDFWTQIEEWIDNGDSLIIGGDWNHDVRDTKFLAPFTEHGLIPAITSRHGKEGPETYSRGSSPIDEIFVSGDIDVVAAGYMAHGESIGDHRPIWIDITKLSSIGGKLPPLSFYQARRLKLNDPRVVNQYISKLESFYQQHKIYDKVSCLIDYQADAPLPQKYINLYEEIDTIRVQGMRFAEKHCRKLRMDGVAWSPQLQRTRNLIKYLKLSLSKLRGRKISTRYLLRLSKQVDYDVRHFSVPKIQDYLDCAFKEYKRLKQLQWQLRQSHLDRLAQALQDQNKGNKAKIVQSLIHKEKQREMFRKLKVMRGKSNKSSTSFFTITEPDGTERDVSDRDEMYKILLERNFAKYMVPAQRSPFTKAPLRNHFGDYGIGPQTNHLLHGSYEIPSDTTPETNHFLQSCKHFHHQHTTAPLKRSFSEYCSSWNKMKERTTSKGDLHFGHFKAAVRSDYLAIVNYIMAEIPFRTGYSPSRWQEATLLMIHKKAGLYNVDKLRTIVLFHADYNHNNKFLGRKMMEWLLSHDLIAQEQYSCPGRKAIDHVLNRRLALDIIRYEKRNGAIAAIDMSNNFDYIDHPPASLAAQSYGIPSPPIVSRMSTYQRSKFHIQTAYGESNTSFGNAYNDTNPCVRGMGQGAGDAGQFWTVLSSKMYQVLHARGLASPFHSPITQEVLEICGFSFVDDSELIATRPSYQCLGDVLTHLQQVIDSWEGLAHTTGGAISPQKCWWYLIAFEWKGSNWRYMDVPQYVQNEISVLDIDGKRKKINFVPPTEAMEMLGAYLSIDGSNSKQIQILTQKAIEFAGIISKNSYKTQRHEAWITLNTMALKSLEYTAPAMTLSFNEWNDIMKPIINAFLPASGINRHFKRDVVYAPTSVFGLGIKHPYITQGVSHVVNLVDHIWNSSLTGAFIKISLQHLRLEIGSNVHILQSSIEPYRNRLLTNSWVQHLWEFISKQDITIDYSIPSIQLKRQGDVPIMDIISTVTKDCTTIRIINKCRLYLKVFLLSEITTGDGKHLRSDYLHGKRDDNTTTHDGWPEWGRPQEQHWVIWRTVILSAFTNQTSGTLLLTPLGHWYNSAHHHHQWFTNISGSKLFRQCSPSEYLSYRNISPSPTRRHRFQATSPLSVSNINPSTIFPTTVYRYNNSLSHEGSSPTLIEPLPRDSSCSQTYKSWLQYKHFRTHSIQKILECIQHRTAIAGSDGSFVPSNRTGSAAWIIQSDDVSEYISGISISPGSPNIQNSYRSELVGILAILDLLYSLCQRHKITSGSITICCDNKAVINSVLVNPKITCVSSKWKHSDLLSAVYKLKVAIPIDLCFRHVKGHQDKYRPFRDLSTFEQLNVRMDALAIIGTSAQESLKSNPYRTAPSHPFAFAAIFWKRQRVWHNTFNHLHDNLSSIAALKYWQDKAIISPTTADNIFWPGIELAMKSTSLARKRFISKWVSGMFATGENMKRWNYRYSDQCPHCVASESKQHILQCPSNTVHDQWTSSLLTFAINLHRIGTSADILVAIRRELFYWINATSSKPISNPTTMPYPPLIQQAILSQRTIGWDRFLEGFISNDWVIAQEQHYIQINKQSYSMRLWSSRFIRQCWDLTFSIWTLRCDTLHTKNTTDNLHGIHLLHQAITKEWQIGLSRLPHDFSYLFTKCKTITSILTKSTEQLKEWFSLIRAGRELYNDPKTPQDEFTTNKALRQWVGLAPLS